MIMRRKSCAQLPVLILTTLLAAYTAPIRAFATFPRISTSSRVSYNVSSSRRRCSNASPFDSSEYSKADAARREAEELEQLIRGRRGVVLEMIEREWKEALDKAVEVEGESFCHQAYEGYQNQGRGCIFVNVDMGLSSNSKGHKVAAASHVVYRPLEEVVMERSARVKPADQMQIIQRCQEYDPEAGFVLVFGYKGLLGVQVMRPSRPPRQVYQSRPTISDRNDQDRVQ